MHRAASPTGAGRTTTGLPPHLALQTTISNRNFSRLETRVSRRKHSPALSSNRNFRSTISRMREAWGSQFWLRNVAHTSLSCARTTTTLRVAQAGVGLCAFAVGFPSLTSSRGPFTGRRIPLRFHAPTTTACTAGHLTHPSLISNRSACRLEMPESYSKQRTGTLSNRLKFTQQLASSDSHLCRAQTNARLLPQ